jgi:hypothetical protein
MVAQDLMTWMGLVAWMELATRVTKKKRIYRLVLCNDCGPRLDDLDGTGGLDGASDPGQVEEENLLVCPL